MSASTVSGLHRVAILATDGVVPYDLGTATQVFGRAMTSAGRPLYEVFVTTPNGQPVPSSAGFSVLPEHGPDVLDRAGTVVVPGASPTGQWSPDDGLCALIRELAKPERRIMSICTGAFLLAAAGLLDGRPATTHWNATERFARRFPQVRLDPNVLYVDDGDVLTSAGVAAGTDLCLHVVRSDHGSEVANRTARLLVVPPSRDGGQAQYFDRPIPRESSDGAGATRAWLLERLDRPVSLEEMAAHARMSVRTFTRRFRAETGMSPAAWLTTQRLERARHLLETSNLTVDRVAREAGFGTAASLRQQMSATLGVSPATYRRTFAR